MKKLLIALLFAVVLSSFTCALADISYSDYEIEVLALTNRERINDGKEPVSFISSLQRAAGIRAEELTRLYSHTRPDGTRCFTVLDECGITYRSAGENIAVGYATPRGVVNGWMNSPGHRANILSDSFSHMGAGYCFMEGSEWRHHWAQLFIGSSEIYSGASVTISKKNVSPGTSISDMGAMLTFTSSVYGECLCPVIDEMCLDYDPNALGEQIVTCNYRNLSATFTVNVAAQAKSVTLDKNSFNFRADRDNPLGSGFQLTATVSPRDASDFIVWKTSDASVATVDSNGLVTLIGLGKCRITATADSGASDSCDISVKGRLVTKITVSGKKTMKVGSEQLLSVTYKPKKAFTQSVKWKSSDTNIITVDENGNVTAIKKGKVKITATALDGSKVKGTITISVK